MTAPLIAIPRPIQSAMLVPVVGLPPTVAAKCTNTGATRNAATARSSSTIANTRCRLAAGSEKPATNSAGATDAPRPIPIRPEPIRVSVWLGGTSHTEYCDTGRQERHPDQRQVLQLPLIEDPAERRRSKQGAPELRKEEEPEVQRCVVRSQCARGQIGSGHRGGSRRQGHDDPRDRHVLVSMLRIVSSGRLLAVLVDDQDDDQREPDNQRHKVWASRKGWVRSSDAP